MCRNKSCHWLAHRQATGTCLHLPAPSCALSADIWTSPPDQDNLCLLRTTKGGPQTGREMPCPRFRVYHDPTIPASSFPLPLLSFSKTFQPKSSFLLCVVCVFFSSSLFSLPLHLRAGLYFPSNITIVSTSWNTRFSRIKHLNILVKLPVSFRVDNFFFHFFQSRSIIIHTIITFVLVLFATHTHLNTLV